MKNLVSEIYHRYGTGQDTCNGMDIFDFLH